MNNSEILKAKQDITESIEQLFYENIPEAFETSPWGTSQSNMLSVLESISRLEGILIMDYPRHLKDDFGWDYEKSSNFIYNISDNIRNIFMAKTNEEKLKLIKKTSITTIKL